MTQRCPAKVFPPSDVFQHLLGLEGPNLTQRYVAIRLHIAQPKVFVSAMRGTSLLLLHIRQIAVLDESIEAHRTFWPDVAAID